MSNLNVVFIWLSFFSLALNLSAMEASNKSDKNKSVSNEEIRGHVENENACCHYCRQSKNRSLAKKANYVKCSNCTMSYCDRKNCLEALNKLDQNGCLVCKKECCCNYDECLIDHQHCFTYKRNVIRHSEKKYRWVKEKKGIRGADGNDVKKIEVENIETDVVEPSVMEVESDDESLRRSPRLASKKRHENDEERIVLKRRKKNPVGNKNIKEIDINEATVEVHNHYYFNSNYYYSLCSDDSPVVETSTEISDIVMKAPLMGLVVFEEEMQEWEATQQHNNFYPIYNDDSQVSETSTEISDIVMKAPLMGLVVFEEEMQEIEATHWLAELADDILAREPEGSWKNFVERTN